MATEQKFTNETLFVETAITETVKNSKNPPTTKAVYDAIGAIDVKSTVFDKILMSANDTTYEVTIDTDGALAVAEVTE